MVTLFVAILITILVLVVLIIAGGIALVVGLFPYIVGVAIIVMGWKIVNYITKKDKNEIQ